MYKIIVFDVDGTIIDTEKTTLMALNQVLKEDSVNEVCQEKLEEVLGIPGIYAIKKFGLNDYNRSLEKWISYMDKYREHNKLYDGISSLLHSISARGIKLGIVTSRIKKECDSDPLFNIVKDQFDCIITADDTNRHKPSGDPLIKLLEIMDEAPEDVLYIGDTFYDQQCAKEAGVDFIWAGWGTKVDIETLEEPVASHPMNLSNFVGHEIK